jgi:hypothetical protein
MQDEEMEDLLPEWQELHDLLDSDEDEMDDNPAVGALHNAQLWVQVPAEEGGNLAQALDQVGRAAELLQAAMVPAGPVVE